MTDKDIAVLQKRASKQLDAMQNYARWESCRRRQILEYFGEDKKPENCDCDVCRASRPKLKPAGRAASVDAQSRTVPQPARAAAVERAMEPVTLAPEDARLARLKEVRRDVVRAMGTMFFQHLPDELLRRLIANPPKTVLELRDDFEVHNKIIENFGTRILHVVIASQEQPSHASQQRANAIRPAVSSYFHGAGATEGGPSIAQERGAHLASEGHSVSWPPDILRLISRREGYFQEKASTRVTGSFRIGHPRPCWRCCPLPMSSGLGMYARLQAVRPRV